MWTEISNGLGFDHSLLLALSPDKKFNGLVPESYYLSKVLDLDITNVHVAPLTHFTMGGIAINDRCETGVKGLYACGEVCGGVHGANRLGGNALSEAIVFGARAGFNAAMYSLNVKQKSSHPISDNVYDRMLSSYKAGRYSVDDLRWKLRTAMWSDCGIIRNSDGLSNLLSFIDELKKKSKLVQAGSNFEVMKAFEFNNMLTLAEVVVRSSIIRKESRGAHYRSDFPVEGGDEWRSHISFNLKGDKLSYRLVSS